MSLKDFKEASYKYSHIYVNAKCDVYLEWNKKKCSSLIICISYSTSHAMYGMGHVILTCDHVLRLMTKYYYHRGDMYITDLGHVTSTLPQHRCFHLTSCTDHLDSRLLSKNKTELWMLISNKHFQLKCKFHAIFMLLCKIWEIPFFMNNIK